MKKELLSFRNIEKQKQYKGFKVATNNLIQSVRVSRSRRIIEYSSILFETLDEPMKLFLIQWCVYFAKKGNCISADKSALNWAIRQGFDVDRILSYYKTITFHDQQEKTLRYLGLITNRNNFFKNLFAKIWNFLKNL